MLQTHSEEKRVRVCQMWPRAGSERNEQYLTVREILSEASTAADGVLSRKRSDFGRFGFATLGLTSTLRLLPDNFVSLAGKKVLDKRMF